MQTNTELKKGNTSINEQARRVLDITRDEYALCSYVHYRVADPDQPKRGLCCDRKESIAEFIGISRAGLYKMLDRMIWKGLISADPATGFLSSTRTWIDVENEGKKRQQSRHDKKAGVNKVDTDCKQSRHDGVNLVTRNIEVEYDNKNDKSDLKENQNHENLLTKIIETLKTEAQQNPTPNPARPPSQFDTWIQDLSTDHRISEGFTITHKIPSAKFAEYLTRFTALAQTSPENYLKRSDLVSHFLNWSRIDYQRTIPPASSTVTTPSRGAIPAGVKTYGA